MQICPSCSGILEKTDTYLVCTECASIVSDETLVHQKDQYLKYCEEQAALVSQQTTTTSTSKLGTKEEFNVNRTKKTTKKSDNSQSIVNTSKRTIDVKGFDFETQEKLQTYAPKLHLQNYIEEMEKYMETSCKCVERDSIF
ncbi:hypothetical protein DLAC_11823 [Tieghemostelium lacteum]|uniref:Uncharacterized protein n=1 Tax=Tieghemostelium lacteum TaxID=361077 RepID=A0A151Z4H0_TIELA|nr:hypothetical protein DLAC_11823 [Tieghemostelium lacteum]|eukprot:KYQ88694.1 hypothetical protein DLAC_11823 [Tieghemostelium lacteum]